MARFIKLNEGINAGLWVDVDSISSISETTGMFVIGEDVIQASEADKQRIINLLPKAEGPFND